MPKVIAYVHGPARVLALGKQFREGCRRHGVPCEVRTIEGFRTPEPADVVWMYGMGPTRHVFDAYAGKARRLVGDVGYWRELLPRVAKPQRYIRVSVDAQQPDAHLRLRQHPADRFCALCLEHAPVESRGEAVLVCGMSPTQAARLDYAYGQWEADTVQRLRAITRRPILLRTKPKNVPLKADGAVECSEAKAWKSIRSAWAVVCRSGNIGADAILHGVPVFAEAGPGAVYHRQPLEQIDGAEPLTPEARMSALSDLSYWQWTGEEIARGELWANLKTEGLV